MVQPRRLHRPLRQVMACTFLVLAASAISVSLLRGASLNVANVAGIPRHPGRFSGSGTDSLLIYGPHKFTHSGSSSSFTDYSDVFDADTVNGRRYIVEVVNSSCTAAKITINGQDYLGSSEFGSGTTRVLRVVDVIQSAIGSGGNALDVSVKGSGSASVSVRIVRVSDPTFIVYGPKTFTQPTPAAKQPDSFPIVHAAKSPYTLRVINGSGGGSNRVSNATLSVNGVSVIGSTDLGTGIATKTFNATLDTTNLNRDTLYNQTATGTYLSLRFTATDSTPPAVTVSLPADSFATRSGVRVSGSVADETYGILTIDTTAASSRTPLPTPGAFTDSLTFPNVDKKYTVTVHAINSAWLTTNVNRTVWRDTQPPTLSVTSPTDSTTTSATSMTFSGSWSDGLTRTTVTVDGDAVGAAALSGTFSWSVPLDLGPNAILCRATDAAGNLTQFKRIVFRTGAADAVHPSGPTLASATTTGITPFLQGIQGIYQGPARIQLGVDSSKIVSATASVIRGVVFGRDWRPLNNVRVTVANHSEYGYTSTRDDGWFDLVVNGGAPLTLRFTRDGYLFADRPITPGWNAYALADTVAMIGKSARSATVTFAADTVVRGRFASDANGDRDIRLFFRQGTTVRAVRGPADTVTLAAPVTVRATEYTIGPSGLKAMPAGLPPSSAYTYCVDLTMDEADALVASGQPGPPILFSKPVVEYVKNFLHLKVGSFLPSGTYDPSTASWKADSDAVVIKIIGVTSGGTPAAIIDSHGLGTADSQARLDSLGIDTAERQSLASQFAVGDELWRARTFHFSSPDRNLNVATSTAAASKGSGRAGLLSGLVGECCHAEGSDIEIENRVLGETVPIVGTPYSLDYRSFRAAADLAMRTVRIPVMSDSVPSALTRITVRMDVVGRRYEVTRQRSEIGTLPYVVPFTWDGKDAYGRIVEGAVNAQIQIGYGYPMDVRSGGGAGSFGNPQQGRANESAPVGDRSVDRMFWTRRTVSLGAPSTATDGLGGWTVSPHHFYDMTGRGTLYRGDGSLVLGERGHPVITQMTQHVAANDVVLGPDKNFYVAAGYVILKYSFDWTFLGYVAGDTLGNYATGPFTEGATAANLPIHSPRRLAIGPDGSISFVMTPPPGYQGGFSGHVCKITPDGKIHSIAGKDSVLDAGSGDGGPATSAMFSKLVYSIALGPDGSVFVGDHDAHRVRRIGPDGVISTYAGNGVNSSSTASGRADTLALAGPEGLAADLDGNLYIAAGETGTTPLVRKVTPDGLISTLTTIPDLPGGGSAPIVGITVAPDGGLYFTQSGGSAYGTVYRYDADGTLSTVAGGLGALSTIGVFATAYRLAGLGGIAATPDGSIYFGYGNVLRVGTSLPSAVSNEFVVPSDDGSEIYYFDLNGKHLRTKNALTGSTLYTFGYNGGGQLTSIQDIDGLTTLIERATDGTPQDIKGPYGQTTKLTTATILGKMFLKSIADPASQVVSLAPRSDGGGLLDSLMDERNGLHAFLWASDGRLQQDTDPENGATQLSASYDKNTRTVTLTSAANRVSTHVVTDLSDGTLQRRITVPGGSAAPSGLRTAFSDTTSGVQQTLFPDSSAVTTTLFPNPRPSFGMLAPVVTETNEALPSGLARSGKITYPSSDQSFNPPSVNGTWEEDLSVNSRSPYIAQFYSQTSRLVTTSPLLRTVSSAVDGAERPLAVSVTGLDSVLYSYSQGRLTQLQEGGRTWQYTYDSSGRLQTLTDPLSRVTKFGYDLADRETLQTLPDSQAVHLGYDVAGNLTRITPPGRPAHVFDYTGVNLIKTYTPPDVGFGATTTTYLYNSDRQLTQIQRPDGANVTLTYEASPNTSRLASIALPRGSYSYAYRSTGQVNTMSSPDGITLTYAYDGPLQVSESWSGAIGNHSLSVTHDQDFRESTQSVDGNTIILSYDLDGVLVGAGLDSLHHAASNALLDSTKLAGRNMWSSQDYNSHGELMNLRYRWGTDSLYLESLARDNLGQITGMSEAVSGDTTRTFSYVYTTKGRLREVDRGSLVLGRWSYDGNGNRTAATGPGGANDSASATYDAQDRLLRYGTTAYNYSKNGELTRKVAGTDTTAYTYDELGNLVTVILPSKDRIDYLIDGRNRRVGRKVNGHGLRVWLYQDQLNPVAELDSTGAVVARYVYGSRANVPDYMVKQGTTYRLVTNQLGSVRLVVDSTGYVAQRIDYDAWGNIINDTNTGFQLFGFAGGIYDAGTRLVRFGARDYDGRVGRWTAKDPLAFGGGGFGGFSGGLITQAIRATWVTFGDYNLSTYTDGDPVNVTDPLGLYRVNPKVPAPSPQLAALLKCIEARTGIGLYITSTSEDIPQHKPGSPHRRGLAADLKYSPHASEILCAAAACGAGYGLDEKLHPSKDATGPHIHVQIPPGKYGGHGDLPKGCCQKE